MIQIWNLKNSEPIIWIQSVWPHIYSPEIYCNSLPFPESVSSECQMRNSIADCKSSSSFSWKQIQDSSSDPSANSTQHGLPEGILMPIAEKTSPHAFGTQFSGLYTCRCYHLVLACSQIHFGCYMSCVRLYTGKYTELSTHKLPLKIY